jgi:small-conductance mechanosensitive channel
VLSDLFRGHTAEVLRIASVGLAALVAALVLRQVIRARKAGRPELASILQRTQSALITLIVVAAIRIGLVGVDTNEAEWARVVEHILTIAFIVAMVWFVCEVIIAIEGLLLARYTSAHVADGIRIRKANTQITLLRRLLVAVVITFGIAAVLMTFPAVRVMGQGLLASAGLISIVAGLAAQSVLGNVIAGIQLALTDSIRVGDVVNVEDESGTVGEITLTYVVVYLWDDRRLILPSSYFTTTPFENWTRWGDRINSVVLIDVDWTVPLDDLRAELDRALAETPLWDGRTGNLVVANVQQGSVTLRITASAATTDDMFGLNAHIRETVVRFLAAGGGEGLPRMRTDPLSEPPASNRDA